MPTCTLSGWQKKESRMKLRYTIHSIYHIAKADFLQRIRSYNFLIALGACIFLIYSFVPSLDAGYVIVSLGNYRGLYNAAWIGGMVANCVPFYMLIGFYLVNYAVKRDFDTGVGQIIATSPITKAQYLTGKLISNFTVLLFILLVIALMTIVMFFVRGETNQLEFGKLLLPLLLHTVPAMFILASIAVFFDSQSGLNRGMINIIYFFLWIFLISISLASPLFDVFGMTIFITEIQSAISTVHLDWNGDFGTGILIRDTLVGNKIFTWEGMTWTSSVFLDRLFWMTTSFGLVLLASLGFNRFDTSKSPVRKLKKPLFQKKKSFHIDNTGAPSHIKFKDTPLPEARFSMMSLLVVEMRFLIKGNSTLWLISTSILFIVSILSPIEFAYKIALPLLWFFQTLVLSRIGSREIINKCNEYIFSAAYPLRRQLPATMSAAILFMLLLALPVSLRVLFNGGFYSVYAIVVGALFIPVFALTLGILSEGSKLFEVIITIIVYGYFNGVYFFDFTGAIGESHEFGMAHYLLGGTFTLVILAFLLRNRQIRHS
jgi:hypothetical protein